jgi:pSer/pThr/pTyr-binding forkhead associated (FHA) protein
MLDASMDSLMVETCLELRLADQIIEVGRNRPAITLGRQSHNDLVIDDIRVSRAHARIEYRRGKFVLIDQSTNGTYAIIQGENKIKLRRDEASLQGNGVISLGRKTARNSTGKDPLIHYEIKLA